MKPVFNLQPELLEDNLVCLQPLADTDFEGLYNVASDPNIWKQHPDKERYNRSFFSLYFDGAVRSKSAFLVFDKETGEIIGSTRFYDFDAEASKIAIGYTFLAKKYWGGRYNMAMKKLLIDYAFQYVDEVLFHIGQTNIISQKAVLKLGATFLREMEFGADRKPYYEYSIKKEDWNL